MTLDITSFIVERGGDPEVIKESQRKRGDSVELVDEVIAMYKRWVEAQFEANQVKKQINAVQKEITAKRKAKEPADEFVAEKTKLEAQVAEMEKAAAEEERIMRAKAGTIGNLVNKEVPVSQTEDDNKVLRTWHPDGPNAQVEKKTDILAHHEVMIRLGAFDTERGSKVAGHRGFFLTDDGVDLNQALINYGLDFLRKREYKKIQPPFFMRKDAMAKTAQLDQFDEELYKVSGDGEDKYLIATSEQPISAFHSEELFDQPEKQLPLKYAGYSTCFRKEAGAAGRDTWGIFRFCITQPEHSWDMFNHMVENAEAFYQSLKIPYQVVAIVSGALNLAASQKYDLEAWFPFQGAYKELVSCSNCTDYQSRRLRIQCGQKQKGDSRTNWVHMLNGTLCATERALCCIVENYQTPEGLTVPEVLRPYMQGREFLPSAYNDHEVDTMGLFHRPRQCFSSAHAATDDQLELAFGQNYLIVAVVCIMLVALGWWKRRKRTREFISQLQTPAATNTNNNTTNNATTQTTPSTGADAPARPPRRRRRRRPSQISTKSLPAYNEQAGDEEIVLVRPAQRQDESDDEDDNENNRATTSRPVTATNAPDSRPLLDDDSSPDMPRVSLASSTRNQSLNEQPDQSQGQSQLGHESIAQTTFASSIAETEPEPSPAALQPPEIPSYTEAMSTSHVNLPTETEHTAHPSTSTATDDDPAVPADADATVRPKRKSVFRHLGRFHINKPASSTPATESVEMTAPRTSTSSHRPSGSVSTHRPSTSLSTHQHKPSPSLSSLSLYLTRSQSPTMSRTSLNISAPIHTTLVRTELNYPKAGPTPEQIRFLSSRESLGRFGMPYGDQAIAAAKSREYLPPVYQPRSSGSGGAEASGSGGAHSTHHGATRQDQQEEEEPTLTIRRGPILFTPGELAQRQSENAVSGRPEPNDDHRPDSDPVLDPAMTISEEPKAVNNEEPEPIEQDSKSIRDQARESRGAPERPADTREPDLGGIQVEPRARVSPQDDRPRDDRRESILTTHSFVTATEGQGDSSPPTPTADTYQQASVRGQTVLIPESREALHPELTLVPATPIS
ncbi:unnamed protein product [Rhizoctonia solani]|uniref:serine--tRNA ligase n=1 Tax=Rhizoctonia solani TaxID=456999 RepID=A0A8H3HE92_9AGAM|nr:unnamed protein product [Rhizoctonia solani]